MGRPVSYALRPAKNIERKMMVDVFKRFSIFAPPSAYQYIGFGSEYFSDFVLVHRVLGIHQLTSIEKNSQNEARYELNRPFGCIKLKFGEATEVLPDLDWRQRAIVWLDYEDRLSSTVLGGMRFAVTNAVSGSVLIVTVNADQRSFDTPEEEALDELRAEVGEARVPPSTTLASLSGLGRAKLYARILDREIREIVRLRNKGLKPRQRLNVVPIFHFHYKDAARMLTYGVLLLNATDRRKLPKAGFGDFDYIRGLRHPYPIQPPLLTYREIRQLDRIIPFQNIGHVDQWGIPREHAERYQKVYRYFPSFAETEL